MQQIGLIPYQCLKDTRNRLVLHCPIDQAYGLIFDRARILKMRPNNHICSGGGRAPPESPAGDSLSQRQVSGPAFWGLTFRPDSAILVYEIHQLRPAHYFWRDLV